jgi:hypothetical protein
MSRIFTYLGFLLALVLATSCSKDETRGMDVIGEVAVIDFKDADFSCLARIDTGAASSSIHVSNIKIDGDVEDIRENIGKMVTFETVNDLGLKKTFTKKVIDSVVIKNSQGIERRYIINMTIGWRGHFKEVSINLRDRSDMAYMLLIGRNFLKNDFLVDVSKTEDNRK